MKYQISKTATFDKWFRALRDKKALRAIVARPDRFAAGNPGDVKSAGDGVCEMRIFTGKGYRLYFTLRGRELVILLCGGDKGSQQRDIRMAKDLCENLEVWHGRE